MMIRQDISQFLPRELMITKPISKYIICLLYTSDAADE